MDWLRWHLGPHKKVAMFAAAIIAVALAAAVLSPANDWPRGTNNGFGPDWECTSHPMSEPTCIKKFRH
jgi:hypothetical protein